MPCVPVSARTARPATSSAQRMVQRRHSSSRARPPMRPGVALLNPAVTAEELRGKILRWMTSQIWRADSADD